MATAANRSAVYPSSSPFRVRRVPAAASCQTLFMLSIGTVVLGVGDVWRAVDFWTQALSYIPREEVEDDWCVLVPAARSGPGLALGFSETPVQEHPRVHLDLYADDQPAEVERLVSLGATRVDWDLYSDDADYVVLADPDGNRFCVIDKSHG